jgi:RNA polymerase sigma-70 factor, ECF subfamily
MAPRSVPRSNPGSAPESVLGDRPPLSLVADEQALVAAIRTGDLSAFEALFRQHYRALYEVALGYVRDRADAEDVAHDVLIAIWKGRATLDIRSSLRAYLFTAVQRRARKRAARPDFEAGLLARWHRDPVAGPVRDIENAAERLERSEVYDRISQAVAALPRRQREVFALRAGAELRYAEIADALGTTVKNVEVQLRRAVRALRVALPDLKR